MTYIDPSGKILAHLDRLAAWKRGEHPAPVTVEWDLSNRCQLGCADCHFAHVHSCGPHACGATTDVGDVASTALVMRGLHEMKTAGVGGVVWSGGGEPLTHPEFSRIAQWAAGAGLDQGLYTNGLGFRHREADLIRDLFKWVVVSLDCASSEAYAAYKDTHPAKWGVVIKNIAELARAKGSCAVGVSFLLDQANWEQAPDMVRLARSLGATYTTFRPLVHYAIDDPARPDPDTGWIADALPMLAGLACEPDVECSVWRFEEYRDWNRSYPVCYGCRFNATVTPDGRLWICPNRRGFPDSCIGSLALESFADLWVRHPGEWRDLSRCRFFCRFHMMNETLWEVYKPRQHENFV
jgi:MoaA/NifB/PqqE/SkfB family radical SAM enzyme